MIRTVLIVDDEPLAAQSLMRKLEQIDSTLEIRTAHLPIIAIDIIKEWHPHLLFLDISMPEISGFDLLDQLDDTEQQFVLIFCTAHNEYAINAFEKSALDYLVKPVKPSRLATALQKANRIATGEWINRTRDTEMPPMQKVACSLGGNKLWLHVEEIAWFSSEKHETVVHDENGAEYFCPLSLTLLEQKLDPAQFFRCHRSHIINKTFIHLFNPGDNQVVLSPYPNTPIPVSRRLKQPFKKFTGL